jgi:protein TonB
MFEDSTFESAGRIHTRSRRWMIAAFAFNASIVVAFVLIPLICPEALTRPGWSILLTVPAPPAAQPRPQPVADTSRPQSQMENGHIVVPSTIPTITYVPTGPEPALIADQPGFDTGIGVPGGIGPAIPGQPRRPVVRQEATTRLRVSSGTEEGLLIHKPLPAYPPIAIASHTEGTVMLAATISRTGTIENLRVISGPALLQQAALNAVSTWLYRPYLLDGQPVEVETTVNVSFTLGR